MIRRSFALLALAACGKGTPAASDDPEGPPAPLEATARIEGSTVVVHAKCPAYWTIEIVGQSAPCLGTGADVKLVAAKLGAGHHDVAMSATGGFKQKTITGSFAVDVPAAAVAPYFVIDGCASEYEREDVGLFVKGAGKPQMCRSYHGARAKLQIKASPNAKVTIGVQTMTVPDSGELEPIVDLTEPLLGLTIDQLAVDSLGASPTMTMPWKLDAGGSQLTGTLEITEEVGEGGKLARQLLKDVAAGKVDRPAFTVAKPSERRTIALLGLDDKATPTDRRGTVRDLDLVAVERETARTESGTCEFDSNGKVVRARRFSVEVEVTVTNLADGTVVATKKFAPSKDSCPMFEMMDPRDPQTAVSPNQDGIMAWLETLTRATS